MKPRGSIVKSNARSVRDDDDEAELLAKDEADEAIRAKKLVHNFIKSMQPVKFKSKQKQIIAEFNRTFFKSLPRASEEDILYLYCGQEDKIKGLLESCGNTNLKSIGAIKASSVLALQLLCRLLDPELNKYADNYLQVLSKVPIKYFQGMKLARHILSEQGIASNAFKFVYILRDQPHSKHISLSELLQSKEAETKYSQWIAETQKLEEDDDQAANKEPECWADVDIEGDLDDGVEGSGALKAVMQMAADSADKDTEEPRDPLGIAAHMPKKNKNKKMAMWRKVKQQADSMGESAEQAQLDLLDQPAQTGSVDPNVEDFNPVLFLTEVHSRTSFHNLANGLNTLQSAVGSRVEQIRSLVQQHYRQFIFCQDTIEMIHDLLRAEVKAGGSNQGRTAKLIQLVDNIKSSADLEYQPLLARKEEADRIRETMEVLKRFKFVFALPSNLRQYIKTKQYEKVMRDVEYAKMLTLPTTGSQTIFNQVLAEIDDMVAQFRRDLLKELENPWSQHSLLLSSNANANSTNPSASPMSISTSVPPSSSATVAGGGKPGSENSTNTSSNSTLGGTSGAKNSPMFTAAVGGSAGGSGGEMVVVSQALSQEQAITYLLKLDCWKDGLYDPAWYSLTRQSEWICDEMDKYVDEFLTELIMVRKREKNKDKGIKDMKKPESNGTRSRTSSLLMRSREEVEVEGEDAVEEEEEEEREVVDPYAAEHLLTNQLVRRLSTLLVGAVPPVCRLAQAIAAGKYPRKDAPGVKTEKLEANPGGPSASPRGAPRRTMFSKDGRVDSPSVMGMGPGPSASPPPGATLPGPASNPANTNGLIINSPPSANSLPSNTFGAGLHIVHGATNPNAPAPLSTPGGHLANPMRKTGSALSLSVTRPQSTEVSSSAAPTAGRPMGLTISNKGSGPASLRVAGPGFGDSRSTLLPTPTSRNAAAHGHTSYASSNLASPGPVRATNASGGGGGGAGGVGGGGSYAEGKPIYEDDGEPVHEIVDESRLGIVGKPTRAQHSLQLKEQIQALIEAITSKYNHLICWLLLPHAGRGLPPTVSTRAPEGDALGASLLKAEVERESVLRKKSGEEDARLSGSIGAPDYSEPNQLRPQDLGSVLADSVFQALRVVKPLKDQAKNEPGYFSTLDTLAATISKHFVGVVYEKALARVATLYLSEDWSVNRKNSSITRLPHKFKRTMLDSLKLMYFIPVPKTKLVVETMVKPFLECCLAFADALHALVFGLPPGQNHGEYAFAGLLDLAGYGGGSTGGSGFNPMHNLLGSHHYQQHNNANPSDNNNNNNNNNNSQRNSTSGPAGNGGGGGGGGVGAWERAGGAGGAGTVGASVSIFDSASKTIMDRRLLSVASNALYTNGRIIPVVWGRLKQALPPQFHDCLETPQDEVSYALEAVATIAIETYGRTKAATVRNLLNRGVLHAGIDWAHASQPQDILWCSLEIMLHLVHILHEVTRTRKEELARVMRMVVNAFATEMLDCVNTIITAVGLNANGATQLLMDVEFIKEALPGDFIDDQTETVFERIEDLVMESGRLDENEALQIRKEEILERVNRANSLALGCFRPQTK